MEKFEDQYLDVLHNIETALTQMYEERAEMTDWEARDAVNGLMRVYKAEQRGRAAPTLKLNPVAQIAFANLKMICDFRLGRATILTEDGTAPTLQPKTLDEMIACLQRILRSIELWQKDGGRRGYYNFTSQFLK